MGISVDREKIVLRKHVSRIVIPSEAEGSFSLAVKGSVPDSEKWETPYRRKGGDGASPKRLGERGGERALTLLEMRGISPKKALKYETAHHSHLLLL